MKTKFLLLILIISGVCACSKSDDSSDNDMPDLNSRLTAKINGEQFNSSQVYVSIQEGANSKDLTISGNDVSAKILLISLFGLQDVGTYELNSGFSSVRYFNENDEEYKCSGTSDTNCGAITVLSDDGEEIKGTFTAELTSLTDPNETISITDGEFTAEYYTPN
ncbi:DUF6252 family protein [Winogradskyella sp. PG-2]|uniref:DUF6252 family protein n=1 Tax=Winogradskyella sp. PG-2 TaxID=754409 RepID=UPI0004589A33|nr:DUF6252 family protein [Winogradskyella sp. PG-2]BAO77070.1 hypothetical protein WPG_2840 [Winogradskyella sp. PG-2]